MEAKKKQAIIDATFQLLENKDINSISVREIATKAGVNVATISYYFGGKVQLFTCLMELYWEDLIVLCENLLKKETLTREEAYTFCKAFLHKEMNSIGIMRSEQILHQKYPVDDKTRERVGIQLQAFQKIVMTFSKEPMDEKVMLAKVIALASALSQPAYYNELAAQMVGELEPFIEVYVRELVNQL